MDLYDANRYQPDICLSLASEWLTYMAVSPDQGRSWCTTAHAAAEDSAFYTRHKQEQAELTNSSVLKGLQKTQQLLKITAFAGQYAHEALQLIQARTPVVESMLSKKADKVKLLRIRQLRVVRGQDPATLEDLKTEFLRLSPDPRYYLISVRTRVAASHAIAVVSTKSEGIFAPRGYLYYYDPNLKRVVRWSNRTELNNFLDSSLLVDYASVNHIWQVERI